MITDYSSLQSAVADHLNRTDLTTPIPILIQLGEAKLRRDPRVKTKVVNSSFAIAAGDDTPDLPAECKEVISLELKGAVQYGALQLVADDQISALYNGGLAGVPRYAARVGAGLRLAPKPDANYTAVFAYWQNPAALSGSNTTNWLLTAWPDIYLYAALAEAAPYLRDDERVPMWVSELENRLEQLHQYTVRQDTAGSMVRRTPFVIG